MKFDELSPTSREAVGVYFDRIASFLRTRDVDVQELPLGAGYAVVKGNWAPSYSRERTSSGFDHLVVSGLTLSLRDCVLHERVLVLSGDIPVRSHEETDMEVATNIGDIPVFYVESNARGRPIDPNRSMYTVRSLPNGIEGFFHGFQVSESKTGLLYIAKALKRDFVEGNSFRMPKNSYRPE